MRPSARTEHLPVAIILRLAVTSLKYTTLVHDLLHLMCLYLLLVAMLTAINGSETCLANNTVLTCENAVTTVVPLRIKT